MTPENPRYAYPQTHEYLVAALKDRNRPIEKIARQNVRATNILYLQFGTQALLGDIGRIYSGISRQRVHTIIEDTVEKIHTHASPKFQKKFLPSEIPLDKPYTPRRGRMISRGNGGLSLRVEKMVQRYGNSLEATEKIRKRLRLSYRDLDGARDTLRHWGIDIPYFSHPPSFNTNLAKNLASAADLSEIKTLLPKVTRQFYQTDLSRKQPLLVPLKTAVARDFHVPNHQLFRFKKSLDKTYFPLVTLDEKVKTGPQKGDRHLHLLASQTLQKARRILLADSKLTRFRQNPVRRICGPDNRPVPTTFQIYNPDLVSPLSLLLRELNIPSKGPRRFLHQKTLLAPNCPVDIFHYRGRFTYYPQDKKILKNFLHRRNQESLLDQRVQKPGDRRQNQAEKKGRHKPVDPKPRHHRRHQKDH